MDIGERPSTQMPQGPRRAEGSIRTGLVPVRGFAMIHAMNEQHSNEPTKQFRGWRLIGAIMCVVVVLAVVSFIVDWMVIGPLEGRVF